MTDIPEDSLLEGGNTPEERQASFLELALCLAAGLPDAALNPLFVVSKDPWICKYQSCCAIHIENSNNSKFGRFGRLQAHAVEWVSWMCQGRQLLACACQKLGICWACWPLAGVGCWLTLHLLHILRHWQTNVRQS